MSTFKSKVDLHGEVYDGVTYRQVRDAFNRLGGNFHQDIFGLAIWKDDIGEVYRHETGGSSKLSLKELFRWDGAIDKGSQWLDDCPKTVAAIKRARERAGELCAKLEKENYIEPYQFNSRREPKRWQLTERAATLQAQKLLRRISRARALSYLPRIIEAAERFNQDDGPNYHIVRIYLFGSLLTTTADVGDVDLVVVTRRRYHDKDFEDWLARERRRLRETTPSGLFSLLPSTESEGPKLINKISPYVSVVSRETMLEQLREKGEPFQVIYAFRPPYAAADEKKQWQRDAASALSYLSRVGLPPPVGDRRASLKRLN